MVLAGERAWQPGGESVRGIQRPDSGRGCRHLRSGAEEPALPQLLAWALQRDTGKRRARVPSDVCGMDGSESPRTSSRKRWENDKALSECLGFNRRPRTYAFKSMQVTSSRCG